MADCSEADSYQSLKRIKADEKETSLVGGNGFKVLFLGILFLFVPSTCILQLFLLVKGTGVSTAVPKLGHVLDGSCEVCMSAHTDPESKNKRNNVSIAILFSTSQQSDGCIMIDCGKTMRQVSSLLNYILHTTHSLTSLCDE